MLNFFCSSNQHFKLHKLPQPFDIINNNRNAVDLSRAPCLNDTSDKVPAKAGNEVFDAISPSIINRQLHFPDTTFGQLPFHCKGDSVIHATAAKYWIAWREVLEGRNPIEIDKISLSNCFG